jgi:serine/threonine-protein kinase
MISCPSHADLQDLLAHQLSTEWEQAVLAHVETCPACQQTLEELTTACAPGSWATAAGNGVEPSGESSPEKAAFWRGLKAALPGWPSTILSGPESGRVAGAKAAETEAALPVRLGRYELLEEIGRGGMGTVLRGHDPDLGRDLAVKVLLPGQQHDPSLVSRFTEEAQIGGQLQHPGIVPVYEVGRSPDQRPYFTMKLVRGRTLAALLGERSHPGQDLPRFLQVFEQVCQTMAYAHSRGVIHRDLKPSNVMVGAFGEVQVMDWGLAKVLNREGGGARPGWSTGAVSWGLDQVLDRDGGVSPRAENQPPGNAPGVVRTIRSAGLGPASEPGHVLGTPPYMAPEQALGAADRLDERCDVFGLGAILCEILTGQPPYGGADALEVLHKAMRADLVEAFARLDACGADPDLIRLVRSSLAAQAADRPRDAGVLAAELASHRESMEVRLRQAELAQAEVRTRAAEERKRRRVIGALAGSVLLTLLLVGGGLFMVMWVREARETQARDALAQAQASWERARAGNDPVQRAEARSQARRAETLLEQGPAPSEMAEQAANLLHAMDVEQEDRQMVHRLTEAILRGTALKEEFTDQGLIVRAYEEAFRLYGIPVQHLPLEEAAERLHARSIRGELAAALDHWASLKHKASERKHLQELAIRVDDDRRRNEIRHALAQKDLKALKRLSTPDQWAGLPTTTVALLVLALAREKAFVETEALLLRARQEHPEDFWINFYLGSFFTIYCKPPRFEEATRFYTAAVAVRSDSPAAHLSLGVALRQRGRLEEAQAAFEKALRLQPDSPGAHNSLGTVLYQKGELDAAIVAFEEAIRLDKDNAVPHLNLGSTWHEKGRLDRAIACFEKALRLKKDYAEAHYGLGNVWRKQRRYDAAIAAYKEALRCKPDYGEAQNNLGLALRDSGRPSQKAMKAFRKAIALDPTLPQPHYNLGKALQREGRSDEAIDAYRKAVTLKMDHLPEVHMDLGVTLAQKGRLYEAVDAFREAIRLKKDYAKAHSNLGGALYKLGQMDRAISSCREAIRLQPTLAAPHNILGLALEGKGYLDEGISAYRRAIRLDKDYLEAHCNLGLALARKGLLDEAIAAHRQAIRLRPDYALAHCGLGCALRDQGQFAEALASLRRGHKLGSQIARWDQPSAEWVRRCERLIELERKLPAIRDGKAKSANATEQIEFAWLCSAKRFYAAAARLYAEAFADPGEDGEERKALNRYSAACCAAWAGCGWGEDAARLDEKERTRWRKQAQEWLRADLVLHAQRLENGTPADRREVEQQMQRWLTDAHLVGVRDAEAMAKLPAEEREEWTKLWAEAKALQKKIQAKTK